MIRVEPASARLRPFIRCYVHVDADCGAHSIVQPVGARTAPAVEFTFGDPYKVEIRAESRCETAHGVAVIGAQTHRRVDLTLRGHVETFVIVFQPGGLFRLFSVPADLLTDAHFEGQSVLGRSADDLRSRLGESRSFSERIRIVERDLTRRPTVANTERSVIDVANAVLGSRGALRIAAMAESAGLSVRQFERRFASQIGMSPKLFACVARFEAALECKRRSAGLRWIDIAHELGYHDQAHMVHDFQRLAGSNPDAASRMDMVTLNDRARRDEA
jgi:AraC-like DNA-binding protein